MCQRLLKRGLKNDNSYTFNTVYSSKTILCSQFGQITKINIMILWLQVNTPNQLTPGSSHLKGKVTPIYNKLLLWNKEGLICGDNDNEA